MIKYPSIDQFRNVIRTVKSNHDYKGLDEEGNPKFFHDTPYPILTFKGTVKLHGTNAAIVKYKDGKTVFQSRERELSLTSDNAGFMLAMSNIDLNPLFEGIEHSESIAIYGEWCGGNIQKGVAVCGLPKMFVIFGCLIDGVWMDCIDPEDVFDMNSQIFHVNMFPTYIIEIDFNQPETIQNKLIDLTIAVEDECPVGKYFGVNGIGEGIVFTCVSDSTLKFKSKGEKHSSSKVKVLNAVDTEEIASINEFVDYAVTESRLSQAWRYLEENNIEATQRATGDFIRWVVNDITKEETDTIVANQINLKKANGSISVKAKQWYFNKLTA